MTLKATFVSKTVVPPESGATPTVMFDPSLPATAAVNVTAGAGAGTAGGCSSPLAAWAVASARSVACSAESKNVAQADSSWMSEPLNWNADSGTNCCAPSESVNDSGP